MCTNLWNVQPCTVVLKGEVMVVNKCWQGLILVYYRLLVICTGLLHRMSLNILKPCYCLESLCDHRHPLNSHSPGLMHTLNHQPIIIIEIRINVSNGQLYRSHLIATSSHFDCQCWTTLSYRCPDNTKHDNPSNHFWLQKFCVRDIRYAIYLYIFSDKKFICYKE